jgi:hypothetical protein
MLASALRLGSSGLEDLAHLLERAADQDARSGYARPAPFAQGAAPAESPPAPPVARPPAPRGPSPTPALEPLLTVDHVDEEPVLVAEFAEPGAEDGAGAHVRVEEPWKGYAELTAAEVIDRLVTQSDSALALVVLYEQSHRGRRTVIAAARSELRRRAAAASAAVPAT